MIAPARCERRTHKGISWKLGSVANASLQPSFQNYSDSSQSSGSVRGSSRKGERWQQVPRDLFLLYSLRSQLNWSMGNLHLSHGQPWISWLPLCSRLQSSAEAGFCVCACKPSLSLFLPRPAYSEVPGKTILVLREELGESGVLDQGVGDQKMNVMQLDCL